MKARLPVTQHNGNLAYRAYGVQDPRLLFKVQSEVTQEASKPKESGLLAFLKPEQLKYFKVAPKNYKDRAITFKRACTEEIEDDTIKTSKKAKRKDDAVRGKIGAQTEVKKKIKHKVQSPHSGKDREDIQYPKTEVNRVKKDLQSPRKYNGDKLENLNVSRHKNADSVKKKILYIEDEDEEDRHNQDTYSESVWKKDIIGTKIDPVKKVKYNVPQSENSKKDPQYSITDPGSKFRKDTCSRSDSVKKVLTIDEESSPVKKVKLDTSPQTDISKKNNPPIPMDSTKKFIQDSVPQTDSVKKIAKSGESYILKPTEYPKPDDSTKKKKEREDNFNFKTVQPTNEDNSKPTIKIVEQQNNSFLTLEPSTMMLPPSKRTKLFAGSTPAASKYYEKEIHIEKDTKTQNHIDHSNQDIIVPDTPCVESSNQLNSFLLKTILPTSEQKITSSHPVDQCALPTESHLIPSTIPSISSSSSCSTCTNIDELENLTLAEAKTLIRELFYENQYLKKRLQLD